MENKELLSKYFSSLKIEEPKIETENTSLVENDFLFSNPTSDVESFIKLEELKIKIRTTETDRKLRKRNAKYSFWFSVVWALFICIFVLLYGFKLFGFTVSETSFMFVCGTLTTTILVFYLTVIRNLFPVPTNPDK